MWLKIANPIHYFRNHWIQWSINHVMLSYSLPPQSSILCFGSFSGTFTDFILRPCFNTVEVYFTLLLLDFICGFWSAFGLLWDVVWRNHLYNVSFSSTLFTSTPLFCATFSSLMTSYGSLFSTGSKSFHNLSLKSQMILKKPFE